MPFTVISLDNPNGTILPPQETQGIDYLKGADVGSQYFVEYVKQQLNQRGFSDAEIFGGGLKVYTTLDLGMQAQAWTAVTGTLDRPDDPSASLVSLDPDNHVKAMIGGRDFATDKVNRAVPGGGGSGRQAGSSMKPFTLSAAVQQGISLKSLFDAPSRITIPKANGGKDWVVNNAEPSSGVLDPRRCDEGVVEHRLRTVDGEGSPGERRLRRPEHGHHDQARSRSCRSCSARKRSFRSTWRRVTRRGRIAVSTSRRRRSSRSSAPTAPWSRSTSRGRRC